MPIYEYYCSRCNKIVSLFFKSLAEAEKSPNQCPECGKKEIQRLLSTVATVTQKASESSLSKTPVSNDPRSLARIMREMKQKSGQDYGSEFNEVVHRLEKGENPGSIERSLLKRRGEGEGPTT